MADLWLTKQKLTAGYGWRNLPGVGRNFHEGADFAFGRGGPVSVCGDGVVVTAGKHRVYGNHVRVDHGGGVVTSYHSLDTIGVQVGQAVSAQQIIGGAGSSAMGSTGPHLHLGLWLDGAHVDPLAYLVQGEVRPVRGSAPAGAQDVARAVQVSLNARGFRVAVDGNAGAQTENAIRQAQAALGVHVDGKVGAQTWPHLAIVQDGRLGAQTVRAVQAALGQVVDGVYGPQTRAAVARAIGTDAPSEAQVRAMQSALVTRGRVA